MLQYIHN